MQLEAIKITDYMKTSEDVSVKNTKSSVDTSDEKTTNQELKTIKIESPSYDKKGKLSDEEKLPFKEDLNEAASLGMETMHEVNNLSKNVDEDTIKKIEDDGFDPMDMEANTIVTVADEIKMVLAKAGVDISKMGGLDSAEVEKMTGSVVQAMEFASGIEDTLSDSVKKFLVVNELEPTISNIYQASYSAPEMDNEAFGQDISDEDLIDLLTKLSDKLDALIAETENGSMPVAEKMLKQDIPLTAKNIEYMAQLENFTKPSEEEILEAIDDIEREGKEPKDAYLIEGYSLMDQAREAVEEINSIDISQLTDVTARRQLEEVRLVMTVEATFTMMKAGVDVDTSNLSKLIDNLKIQETNLLKVLMKQDKKGVSDSAVEIFKETMKAMADIEKSPVQMLGQFSDIRVATLTEVHQVSVSMTAQYTKMEMTYEAVGTEVRRDLGDNINKAFQNVDDILEDIGMERNASNEQAVRILAYNSLEINETSVTTMKDAAELLNRVFKNMTPAVVSEMIKKGENPLDLTMEQLKEKTEAIKLETSGGSETQDFAKFLWKAEHTEGITEEERAGYIGIYRLLNQIEKTDGAAIGALISQGSEITLRNFMTAVRSSKHTGRDYEISDKFGELDELVVKDLSITEQIEKAFMTNRCLDAKEAMTPEKMKAFGEEQILEMNPDEFATAMENEDDVTLEEAYIKDVTRQLKESMHASEETYKIVEEYNLPTTANIISAVEAILQDNNQFTKDLYKRASKQEQMDIEDLIQLTWERFGEACESPEQMAEAQEALGVLAENVMRGMLDAEDTKTIDMDGMKLVIKEAKVYNQLAKEDEFYHIPILVADEAGTMNLKIVRGSNESGLIKMALRMESTGTIAGSFKYEKDFVDVKIECETNEMREAFAEEAPYIAQKMQEDTGFGFSFSFGRDNGISVNDIFALETGMALEKADENNKIQTESLYKIAKSFINIMGEMF